MSWEVAGRPLRRILVTRLRYLGDIVMATVVLDVLRRGDPQVQLGFLCEHNHAPVLAGHPTLQRRHLLSVRRGGADARARRGGADVSRSDEPARGTLGTILDLRRCGYDLAVDLFFNPRSAWLLRLAGVPTRICGAAGSRRRFYTHAAGKPSPGTFAAALDRTAPGGLGEHLSRLTPLRHRPSGLDFADWFTANLSGERLLPHIVRPDLTEAAQRALRRLRIDPAQPFLALAPGATWPSKEWPDEHWQDLIRRCAAGTGLPVAVVTAPGRTAPWPEAMAQGSAAGGVIAPLALPDALAVVAAARALVTVDGGIMHAGVGLGIPTLALFGPTDPRIWFPYTGAGPFRVLATRPECHPCDRHECDAFVCLPELSPGVVHETLSDLLAETSAAAGDDPEVDHER